MTEGHEILSSQGKPLLILAAVAALVAIVSVQMAPQKPVTSSQAEAALTKTMHDVAQKWPKLPHMSVDALAPKLSSGDVVLFDVREGPEFAVSHIPGAHHIAPNISETAFLKQYSDQVQSKLVVFYCSVGVRSSTLAAKVSDQLKARGARDVVDLAGGIFAWHNQSRPLENTAGVTDFVHPYNQSWGRLVARQDFTRMTP